MSSGDEKRSYGPSRPIQLGLVFSGLMSVAVVALFLYATNLGPYHDVASMVWAGSTTVNTADFRNITVVSVGFIQNEDSLKSVISASFKSPLMLILVLGLGVGAAAVRWRYNRLDRTLGDAVESALLVVGPVLAVLLVDTLPDEAYVWAEKMRTFLETGRLGVPLADGTYAEATIGMGQFLIGAALTQIGLSPEQALVFTAIAGIPLLLFAWWTWCSDNACDYRLRLIGTGLIALSPMLLANAAIGIDNCLGVAVVGWWVVFLYRRDAILALVLIAACAPIIRLDLWIITAASAAVLLVRFWRTQQRRTFVAPFSFGALAILIFLLYKYWAYGQQVPAMALYKQPSLAADFLASGASYVQSSWSVSFCFSIALIAVACIFSAKWVRIETLSVFVVVVIVIGTAISSGGDYFDYFLPLWAPYITTFGRYLGPVAVIALFLGARGLSDGTGSVRRARVLTLGCCTSVVAGTLILFPLSGDFSSIHTDARAVQTDERAYCDAASAEAFVQVFGSGRTVGTPELAGFTFHARAKLDDLIGLGDARVYPLEKLVLSPGNLLHKYRMTGTVSSRRPDFLYYYGSAVCQFSDPIGVFGDGTRGAYRDMFVKAFSIDVPQFRLGSPQELQKLGYEPLVINFWYRSPDNRPQRGFLTLLALSGVRGAT